MRTFIGNIKGKQGDKGATGAKLVSQVLQGQDENGNYIYLQTYDDGTTATFVTPRGKQGEMGYAGADGITPQLKINTETFEWEVSYNNGLTWESLEFVAKGEKGNDGSNGITPHIGENGNWFVGEEDTGVKAQGENGEAGIGITEITSGESYEENGTTITPITIKTSDNKETTINVVAKNGSGGESSDNNLLSSAIIPNEVLETLYINMAYKNSSAIGLEEGKTYTILYTYDGVQTSVERVCTKGNTTDNIGIESALTLGDNASNVIFINDNAFFMIADKAIFDNGNYVASSENSFVQVGYNKDYELKEISIDSIAEAKPEYASKESVEALDERVDNLELLHQEPLVATFNITTASTAITVKALTGATQVDWGDGSAIEDISAVTTYTHTYATTGTYEARFYGNITTIGTNAFSSNNYLIKVYIPKSVTSIGTNAFYYASKLRIVKISEFSSMSTIGTGAFDQCGYLLNINIPNSVNTIGERAFQMCQKLKDINLPTSLGRTGLGKQAFYGCNNLSSVVLPREVAKLPIQAFGECGITRFECSETLVEIGALALSGNYLKEININFGLNYNGNTFDYGITIGANAIDYTKIRKIILTNTANQENAQQYPITLKGKIFKDKTANYPNDRILEIRSDTPPTITGIEYIQDDIKIIVPHASLDLYKNAEGWKDKASQIDSEITANEVYALVGNINTELANIIEGEGV